MGCESGKIPAEGEVFFLDFPFYRTTRRTAKMRGNANAVAIRLPGFADLCPPLTSLAQKELPTVNSFDY